MITTLKTTQPDLSTEMVDYIKEVYLVDVSPCRLEFRHAGDLIATAIVTEDAHGTLVAEAGPGRRLSASTLAAFAAAGEQMWRLAGPACDLPETNPYDCEEVVTSKDFSLTDFSSKNVPVFAERTPLR